MAGRTKKPASHRTTKMTPKQSARPRLPATGTWIDGVWVEPDGEVSVRDDGFSDDNDLGQKLQPGNELGLIHGANSPAHVNPLAQVMIDWLMSLPDMPWLQAPQYRPQIMAWADAESRCQLLRAYADRLTAEQGLTEYTRGTEKEARPQPGELKRTIRARKILAPLAELHRHEARAQTLRKELGLTPLSAAKLGAAVAGAQLDLAKLWQQMEEDERRGAAEAV